MNIIILSGPTASGKTERAIEICKKRNGEIISCDSRQVYKYLNIGTNKKGIIAYDGFRRIDGIIQYLTDIINPDQTYNVATFVNSANSLISEITSKGKIPVITGGTGLYIKALLYGLNMAPQANEFLRKNLKLHSQIELYNKLLKLDPKSAEQNKKNPQRLLRALEINIITGKNLKKNIENKNSKYNFEHYSISTDIDILYKKINKRCIKMIESGMIEETQKILNMGFSTNCPAFSGLGYKYVIQYINKKISMDDLILKFSKDTRHYAKRQNTWFRSQPDIEFI
ncbi:MAG: tRNA (adenosine(37)-N6)-dimethylallyltransferase MiaA [Endomicrobium sp.]|jgi:tRNA dimethylallyltransferase|nr:tRNA (adenosine(37)-N6)-dimethylallyltransferase MiaA [Endomicrobium sp.]